jgi:pilus assembly protein Flp/PilA
MPQRNKKKFPHIRILKNSKGQVLIEYGFLLILIAIVVIAAVTLVGQKTQDKYSTISQSLPEPP